MLEVVTSRPKFNNYLLHQEDTLQFRQLFVVWNNFVHQLNQTLDVVRKYLAAHVSVLHPERFSKHTYTISQVSSDETAQTANKLTKIQTICILIIRLVDSLEISFVELFDKPDSSSFFHKLFYEVAEMVYFHLN